MCYLVSLACSLSYIAIGNEDLTTWQAGNPTSSNTVTQQTTLVLMPCSLDQISSLASQINVRAGRCCSGFHICKHAKIFDLLLATFSRICPICGRELSFHAHSHDMTMVSRTYSNHEVLSLCKCVKVRRCWDKSLSASPQQVPLHKQGRDQWIGECQTLSPDVSVLLFLKQEY